MGTVSVNIFLPKSDGDVTFSEIGGQTSVLVDLSTNQMAYDAIDISKKMCRRNVQRYDAHFRRKIPR